MSQRIATACEDDLERRSRRRDEVERLLELAQHLAERDRLLLEQVYRHGLVVADLARVSGGNPDALRRRIQRLIHRLDDPVFHFVVGHGDLLAPVVRRVATRVILHGRPLRQAAADTGLSLHEVREHVAEVRAIARHSSGYRRR
jgi:hypothetical protein